jgi:hypothetical protein
MTDSTSEPFRRSRHLVVFLAFLPSFLGLPAPTAQAQENNTCSEETIAWIVRADAENPASIRAGQCSSTHVVLKLELPGTNSFDVEIAHAGRNAFRRIGRLGVSPVLEVPDFSQLPNAQREAFEALCTWLSAHGDEIMPSHAPRISIFRRRLKPLPETASLGNFWPNGSWGALVLLLGLIAARAAQKNLRTEQGRREWFVLTILFVVALGLRLWFGPFAPHHVNGQGPLWIHVASADPTRLAGYGPGYVELFSFLCAMFPRHPDTTIFVLNACFSAIAAPIVYALARKLGLDARRALVAGALTTVDAVALRFGATEAYFPAIITLTLIAYVLFASAAQRSWTKERSEAIGLAFVGALVCTQAAHIHPIAWGPVAIAPLFVAALPAGLKNAYPRGEEWVRRGTRTLAVAMLVVGVLLLTSGHLLALVAGGVREHWDPQAGSVIVMDWAKRLVTYGLPVLILVMVLAKPRGVIVPAIAAFLALVATRDAYGQSPIWIASYDRLWMAPVLLLLVALIPQFFARTRRAWVWLALTTVGVFVAGLPTVYERTTEQLEYAFFRAAFTSLPEGCRVVHLPRVGRRIVMLPEYAMKTLPDARLPVVAVSSADDVRRLQRSEPCLRYARTSICTSEEGRAACDAVERDLHLVPSVEADLPAKPSHYTSTYDRDVVKIGLFEVRVP